MIMITTIDEINSELVNRQLKKNMDHQVPEMSSEELINKILMIVFKEYSHSTIAGIIYQMKRKEQKEGIL